MAGTGVGHRYQLANPLVRSLAKRTAYAAVDGVGLIEALRAAWLELAGAVRQPAPQPGWSDRDQAGRSTSTYAPAYAGVILY